MRRFARLALAVAPLFAAGTVGAGAEERRCGWLENPTPGNYWLTDADGSWTLSTQGVEAENGFLDLPASSFDFGDEWTETNGSYGYGCACMTVTIDAATEAVTRIRALDPIPRARCEADAALSRPQ